MKIIAIISLCFIVFIGTVNSQIEGFRRDSIMELIKNDTIVFFYERSEDYSYSKLELDSSSNWQILFLQQSKRDENYCYQHTASKSIYRLKKEKLNYILNASQLLKAFSDINTGFRKENDKLMIKYSYHYKGNCANVFYENIYYLKQVK